MEALTTDRMPTRQEINAYGEAARKIYEPFRSKLEAEHWGKYITIHPVNGDYAISRSHDAALNKMKKNILKWYFIPLESVIALLCILAGAALQMGNGREGTAMIKGKIKISLSNDEEPAIGTLLMQDSIVTLNFGTNKLTIEEYAKFKSNKRR